MDYDLLTLGLDINQLGTPDLDWRRLKAIVRYLPDTSALHRSIHGAKAAWSVEAYLLASAVDALNGANWQRAGGKGQRPKPLPRPGQDDKGKRKFGTASIPLVDAKRVFDRINRRPALHAPPRTCAATDCGRQDIHARGMCSTHYQRWWRANRAGTPSRTSRT